MDNGSYLDKQVEIVKAITKCIKNDPTKQIEDCYGCTKDCIAVKTSIGVKND